MPRFATDCPRCKQARRLASFCFAAFALAFIVSAMDDTLDPARQGIVLLCAMMAGLAILRHPIARVVQRLMGKGHRT